jgi:hypothetical protein
MATVEGVAREGLFGAYCVLTTKATSVIAKPAIVTTKAANVASKPASVASKPTSGVSCRQRRWSQCQAQSDSRRRHDITKPFHLYFAFEIGGSPQSCQSGHIVAPRGSRAVIWVSKKSVTLVTRATRKRQRDHDDGANENGVSEPHVAAFLMSTSAHMALQ